MLRSTAHRSMVKLQQLGVTASLSSSRQKPADTHSQAHLAIQRAEAATNGQIPKPSKLDAGINNIKSTFVCTLLGLASLTTQAILLGYKAGRPKMAANKTQVVDTQPRRESTFLSLSPLQSTPPSSQKSTSAIASPVDGDGPTIAQIIEPLKKAIRSSSDSSTASESSGFLRLGPVEQDE
ncbi:hypothetical protein LTR56_024833 [Elasticomyces elasticus]|nr:hypothetical protein LTR56_024833 [Elasticomyces elasticus]KAK3641973.1 hypothetical protein LTR22_016298 [Elasticomyces elasticus]KAK4910676.1 hypothetical protein LTR49_020711 [Elasticomyces elasticus]KAK5742111.1 hypothetical protein LTS12_024394 [Elasticomyces elasticus]